MNSAHDLVLAGVDHAAAKHAVERWHYSRRLPAPPMVRFGVWEDGAFIGVVLFSRGASGNILRPCGLTTVEGCELSRVALRAHRSPVSRIVAVALKLLQRENPGLRLVVSYADPDREHIGAIYQAGNWIYTGTTAPDRAWVDDRTGRRYHSRIVSEGGSGYRRQFGVLKPSKSPVGLRKIHLPGKHRYLYPLDRALRVRLASLARPYPKKAKDVAA